MSVYDELLFAPMLMTDIFRLHGGVGLEKKNTGDIPYIAASFQKNGVVGYVSNSKCPGGWLSFVKDGDGGAGTCFYQPSPFWPSNHVLGLEPISDKVTKAALLVMAATITHQCFPKYNRGFAANLTRLARQKIMVPILKEGTDIPIVDWEGMDRLGKELMAHASSKANMVPYTDIVDLHSELPKLKFEPMLITDVFTPHKGKRLVSAERKPGSTPFIGGSEVYNSVTGFSNVRPLFPGGWLTLTYNGSVGHARLQPTSFFASDDVIVLEPPEQATHEALLMCATIITRECVEKYSYGEKLNLARLYRQTAMFPVKTDTLGERFIDWDGMNSYGRIIRARTEMKVSDINDLRMMDLDN